MVRKNRSKIFTLLFFIFGFETLLLPQVSFDFSSGLALNKSQFAYYSFNDNGGYHNSLIYPIYNTDSNKPYSTSPFFSLGLNTEKSQLFNMRCSFSTGIYSENVTYDFKSPVYGSGHYTRTIGKGSGYIKQLFVRLEITPTIQIRKLKLLFGLINIEKLTKRLGSEIKAEQSTYEVYSKKNSSGSWQFEDSIVTFLGNESITISNPQLPKGILGHRTLFFPIYFGLEYEYTFNKATIVFGSKILVSYSGSYAAKPHTSYMVYVSYRLKTKRNDVQKAKIKGN